VRTEEPDTHPVKAEYRIERSQDRKIEGDELPVP